MESSVEERVEEGELRVVGDEEAEVEERGNGRRDEGEVEADVGAVCARIGGSCSVNGEEEVAETGVAVDKEEVEAGRLVVLRRGELSSREAMEGIAVAREVGVIVW